MALAAPAIVTTQMWAVAGLALTTPERTRTDADNHTTIKPIKAQGDDMPLAYWCVLIAALMPIALAAYAKSGSGGDNHNPRDTVLTGAKRRAYAAHENGFESFPFFAAAVITATTLGASISTVNILAALYIVARGVHAVLYINDAASARSLTYTVALLLNVAIFVLPAFK